MWIWFTSACIADKVGLVKIIFSTNLLSNSCRAKRKKFVCAELPANCCWQIIMNNRWVKHWPREYLSTAPFHLFLAITVPCCCLVLLTLELRDVKGLILPVPKVTRKFRPCKLRTRLCWNNFQISLLLPPYWSWNKLFWLVSSLTFQTPLLLPRILSSSQLESWLAN